MEHTHYLQWLQEDYLAELREIRAARVERGEPLFDLSMINPDLPPPRLLVDKLLEASNKMENHRYAVARGIRKLREAFAGRYHSKFGVELDPDREVCVTMGTKDGLADALRGLCAPGERVLIGAPSYPAHLSAARLAQLTLSFFSITKDEGAMLGSIEAQLKRGNVRAVVLNFPNNPTGIAVSAAFYEKLFGMLEGADTLVINDFVYGEMGFSGHLPVSLLKVAPRSSQVLETLSMSKAFNIPGWRVGAVLGNAEAVHALSRLKAHIDYGIFLPLQSAAAAGLQAKEDLVGPTVLQYEIRARRVVQALDRCGWKVQMPSSGASVWAELPDHVVDGATAARTLLQRVGVLTMPGSLFGREFSRWVRFAMVQSEERLREALNGIEKVTPEL